MKSYFEGTCTCIRNLDSSYQIYLCFPNLVYVDFADFDRLCKLEKRGDEIFKKSSPLKLLSQSQPNFAEMILGWPPSKIVSGDPDFQPRWPPS